MKENKISSLLFIFVLWLIIFAAFSVEAKKNHKNKSKMHKHNKKRHGSYFANFPSPSPSSSPAPSGVYPTQSATFNILSFGAKGNGVSDDSKVKQIAYEYTYLILYLFFCWIFNLNLIYQFNVLTKQALLAAWKSACKVTGAVIEIPSEFKFLIKPITLRGPCMTHLVFQVSELLRIKLVVLKCFWHIL